MRRLIAVLLLAAGVAWAQPASPNAKKLQGRAVSPTAPTDGQGLVWDAATASWKPGTLSGTGDMSASAFITTGAGAPSNPCTTAGSQYWNTSTTPRQLFFCPSAGGNWVGPGAWLAGSSGQVIFHDGTNLSADSGLAYNSGTKALGVIGSISSGQAGTATGCFKILGLTSGTVSVCGLDAAGTWTFKFPDNDGDVGQFLKTDGSGNTSWTSLTNAALPNDPVKSGLGSAAPATCTANKDLYIKTDATAGMQQFICNGTGDGWNLLGDGAAGHPVSATPAADTVPLSGGDGKIAASWLPLIIPSNATTSATFCLSSTGPCFKNNGGVVQVVTDAAGGTLADLAALSVDLGDGTKATGFIEKELVANGTEFIGRWGPDAITTSYCTQDPNAVIASGQTWVDSGSTITPTGSSIACHLLSFAYPAIGQYVTFSGPSAARTYTLPDANKTLMATDTSVTQSQLPTATRAHGFGASFGDGVNTLTAGAIVYRRIPYAGTISNWSVTVDAGTATCDIWKVASGTAAPVLANSIANIAIASNTHVYSATVTEFGANTAVAANDVVGINLKAVATAKAVSCDVGVTQ